MTVQLANVKVWDGTKWVLGAEPAVDPATAFIAATGITDTDQRSAVTQLVLDLKTAGIWTKLHAIYPFVGGTAATHKFNLKDARDLDAAFRLRYVGAPTHSATGFQPVMSPNGYANTHFIPGVELPANSVHMAYYSRTNSAAASKCEMGNYWSGNREHLIVRYSGDMFYYGMGESSASSVSVSASDGLFSGSRTSSSLTTAYRNGSSLGTSSSAFVGHASGSTYIGAMNAYSQGTDRECAFASIGEGLTSAEQYDLYTAVQAFQTTLGRQV